jgi:asparagine synthase (glutamine-hydrolysing)
MSSDDETVIIVFNGEIYNFLELKTRLQDAGYHFKGNSDTEVLLRLYQEEGEEMLQRLNGIFAIAIWDQNRQSLFVARDALGVKPFYFATEEGLFAFASEIKALVSIYPHLGSLDLDSVQRYLSFLWCPGDGTPNRNIRKLLPGQAMLVEQGAIKRCWNWYQLPVFSKKKQMLDRKTAIDQTSDHLRKAVHRQMISDVPVGAFLSGGLDSSAVVAFAREVNPDLRCFTIEAKGTHEEGATDDLPYARRVAKHLNVALDVVTVESSRIATDLQKMVIQLDEPLADPAALNVLYISELARSQGIKVLLSGAGGDDLFTGYRRHRALVAERWWDWLPQFARRGLTSVTAQVNHGNVLARRLAKAFSGAGLGSDERLVQYFRWINHSDLDVLFTPEFRAELDDRSPESPMLDFLCSLPEGTPRLEQLLALEQRFFLPDHNLIYTDKMSMAASVEVRVPFLDTELVEFASAIPVRFKQRGAEGKWVLKKSMEPFLPRDVIYRPKSGFGVPLRSWIRNELHELLMDLLSKESIERRGLFQPQAVHKLIQDNETGRIDASYTLLSLLCIEIWCRHFIDA